jgi:acetyl-CoA carboxylase biotin carboxylase subunit
LLAARPATVETPAAVEETVSEDVVALAAALFSAAAKRETVPVGDSAAESRWAEAGRREGLRL